MASPPKFDVDEARRLYESGLSCRQIADQLGVSFSRVANRLRKAGVTMRPGGRHLTKGSKAIDVDELVRLRNAGASFRQLAERYSVSHGIARERYVRATKGQS